MLIPKAELHVHLEGTAPPELIRRLAERNGLELPAGCSTRAGRFAYTDFLDFLDTYDLRGERHPHRRGLPRHHLRVPVRAARARARCTWSSPPRPTTRALVGLSDEEHLDGIARGIDDARARARHRGPHPDLVRAQLRGRAGPAGGPPRGRAAARLRGGLLDGRRRGELSRPATTPRRSRSPPARGWAARCTPASGPGPRACGRRSSCRSPGSPTACARSRIRRWSRSWPSAAIVLECCPTSNVVLGIYPDYASHPLPRLRDAGVRVTLGSDDPPYFGAIDRRRVRGLRRALRVRRGRAARASPAPRWKPHFARKRSKKA